MTTKKNKEKEGGTGECTHWSCNHEKIEYCNICGKIHCLKCNESWDYGSPYFCNKGYEHRMKSAYYQKDWW